MQNGKKQINQRLESKKDTDIIIFLLLLKHLSGSDQIYLMESINFHLNINSNYKLVNDEIHTNASNGLYKKSLLIKSGMLHFKQPSMTFILICAH